MSDAAAAIGESVKTPRGERRTLFGWGLAVSADAELVRARNVEDLRATFARARDQRLTIGLRGAGCSYGDAALNKGGIVLDVSGMNRILAFDPATGIATLEPGVTISDLWIHALPHGFWPPVVPGTMHATIGGCVAMNIHGKNSFAVGTIGEHVERFTLLTPAGDLVECSRTSRPDLFRAAIGGFGMFGCFTSITLRLKAVPGGRLLVKAFAPRSLAEMVEVFEREKADSDYLVGWIDGFASGARLGRGIVHRADYAGPAEDPEARESLAIDAQHLPARFLGVVPRKWMRQFIRPFVNRAGMRLVNAIKDLQGRIEAGRPRHFQSHAAFAFLLDYVPEWRRAYGRGGLIQYQSFVPAARAAAVHSELISMARRERIFPYLLVYKRHRLDDWNLTHAVDGFSMAMDFKVTARNRDALWELCSDFDEVVIGAGGRFYFAKDATLTRSAAARAFPASEVSEFRDLKASVDPAGILQSDLYRRLFSLPGGDVRNSIQE
jgi:decaprenylphospho-beta-D-ribofuranose 2-oxidase